MINLASAPTCHLFGPVEDGRPDLSEGGLGLLVALEFEGHRLAVVEGHAARPAKGTQPEVIRAI